MSEPILLRAGADDHAAVSPLGAQLSSWRARGVDLLWSPDAAVWGQTAPLLFPVVGWTRNGRARVGDREFPLGLHGFARHKLFALAERSEDSARFVLDEDDETRALYPFAFRLEARFALRPGALAGRAHRTTNRDERPLPYAAGLHPGFRWPLAGSPAPHAIRFERAERAEVPVIAPGGLFSARRSRQSRSPDATLPLTRGAPRAEEALCFLDAASRRSLYDNGDGARALRSSSTVFRISRCGRGPPRPFCASRPGPAMATRRIFAAISMRSPRCAFSRPGESATHARNFPPWRGARQSG